MKKIKLFLIGLSANFIENTILLYYFGVSLNQSVLIGAGVFALASLLVYKLAEGGNNKSQE